MKSKIFTVCLVGLVTCLVASCGESEATAGPAPVDTDAFGIRWAQVSFDSFVDARDGQHYRTVKIGGQTWMAQNLNYSVDSSWCHSLSSDSCRKYGRLYLWSSALAIPDSCNRKSCSTLVRTVGHHGVCPAGWKIPSDSEWNVLVSGLGGEQVAGRKLKALDGWTAGGHGTDGYGFRVLPAGDRTNTGAFRMIDSASAFWSSDESASGYVWKRMFTAYRDSCIHRADYKPHGFSVRCLKNQ